MRLKQNRSIVQQADPGAFNARSVETTVQPLLEVFQSIKGTQYLSNILFDLLSVENADQKNEPRECLSRRIDVLSMFAKFAKTNNAACICIYEL